MEMSGSNIAPSMSLLSSLVVDRLSRASSLAKATAACLAEGQVAAAIDVAMEIEQPIYEATIALNAIRLLWRTLLD